MFVNLGGALAGKANALNFVRLLLASAVIVGHTWPLGGFGRSTLEGVSGVAVDGFFAISGYLIAGSRVRLGLGRYLWHRCLRILPGFWVCLLATAALFAPAAALVEGGAVDASSAVGYVVRNSGLQIRQWGIEHTLGGVPYPAVWNGSLWTLYYEFLAYLVAGAVLTLPVARRHPQILLPGLLGCAVVALPLAYGPLDVTTNVYLNGLRLSAYFTAGMTLWALRESVRVDGRLIAACLGVVVAAWSLPPEWHYAISAVPVAYVVLGLGARLPVRLGSRNDVSYGVYIYAFPAAQLLVVLGLARHGPLALALATFAVTLPLAWISWVLVERPAMTLRRVGSPAPALGLRNLRRSEKALAPQRGRGAREWGE